MLALRAGLPSDVEAMYQLDVECFAAPFRFSLRMMRGLVTQANTFSVVAEVDGLFAGFVSVEVNAARPAAAYVVTLDVDPRRRRTGLARSLMVEAERMAAAKQVATMWLHVDQANETALRFYGSAGYQQEGEVKNFYGEDRNAWVYRKTIEAGDSDCNSDLVER